MLFVLTFIIENKKNLPEESLLIEPPASLYNFI